MKLSLAAPQTRPDTLRLTRSERAAVGALGAEPARVERHSERPSFDLLNAVLPEWPAQACSWA